MSFWVYVIELEPEVWERRAYRAQNPSFEHSAPPERFFYVGQTCLEPRERYEQHVQGVRSSRIVRSHARWLRRRLCRPHATRAEAEAGESAMTRRLQARGWAAYSN